MLVIKSNKYDICKILFNNLYDCLVFGSNKWKIIVNYWVFFIYILKLLMRKCYLLDNFVFI